MPLGWHLEEFRLEGKGKQKLIMAIVNLRLVRSISRAEVVWQEVLSLKWVNS